MSAEDQAPATRPRGLVRNPLTLIAIFAGLAEVFGIYTLPKLSGSVQWVFIWFVVSFPYVLILLFFITLWWDAKKLYGPGDYQEDPVHLGGKPPVQARRTRTRTLKTKPEPEV